jgi:acetyl esterase
MDHERKGYLLMAGLHLSSLHCNRPGAQTMNPLQQSSTFSDERIALAEEGSFMAVRLFAAPGHARTAPLVLHFHAGAFAHGSLDSGTTIAQLLSQAGAVVASVDYPLAPAHPFPAALEAGYQALLWAQRQRRRLAGAHAPLFVAGEEAGGNLAAGVALVARDRDGPPLAGQILLSPMLDMCVATASLRKAHAGPVGCRWADGWRQYLARADDATHPYAAPGRSMRLAGLPRTLLVTAQDDPMRDETLAYAERLREASVAADPCLLPIATGWPASYTESRSAPPSWADAVRERLHRFLTDDSSRTSP